MTRARRDGVPLTAAALAAAALAGAAVPVAAHAHFGARAESGGLTVGTASLPAPADLHLSACSQKGPSRTLTVTWTGSGAASSYVIEHRPLGEPTWQAGGDVSAPSTSQSLSLEKKPVHEIRVTAFAGSWSATSAVLESPPC